ncbi:MAG: UDP-N-acetylmuramoyl-L-alanyl-D-glutamate--2,6-diaminopimelate ligase [Ruminococcaceae bacterium]|nr:UDP-N-acetylmuramoyl-L-alanyl-D-glutamate--2,6-diaminopimelate ligase [Oscillospiraceae bacterium]
MTALLTELLENVKCEMHGSAVKKYIEKIEYNSRLADSSTLFFCMPGARADGHNFAPQAYDLGCRAFVVERILPLPHDAVQILVSNSRETLAYVSAAFYGNPADEMTVIGITGTKGKTTTAILIEEILNSCGVNCGYIGTNGVVIGENRYETINSTPESRELHKYFRMMRERGYTHVVMEVSSQALDHYRVAGIKFDTVIFTNFSEDHIGDGEHATLEEYRDAKRKLFTDYNAKNIIYNIDDPTAEYMINGAVGRLISYGIDNEAEFRGCDMRPFRAETSLGIDFDVIKNDVKTGIRLRTPGSFSVYNGLAAIAASTCCGISIREAADALKCISIKGRFEIVDAIPGITFIIDYAHNGLSLTRALTVLKEYAPKRLICVFGSVGGRTYVRRRELAEAASRLADFSVITSDNPDFEDPDNIIKDISAYFDRTKLYTAITDREEAVRFAVRIANEGDIVLFAGKGHEDYQLIDGKRVPLVERKIILDEAHKLLTQALTK